MRRAVHGTEVDHVATDVQIPFGIARVEHEARGHEREMRLDEVAPEADHLRPIVNERAGAPIDIAGDGTADLEARLLQHPESGEHDALDLLARQDLERRPEIPETADGRERGTGGAPTAPAIAAPRRSCRRLGHARSSARSPSACA